MNSDVRFYEWLLEMNDSAARERLSKLVKELRLRRGKLSQRDFADAIGVGYNAIRAWEDKKSLPNRENFIILATEANQSLDELLKYLYQGEPPAYERATIASDVLPLISNLPLSEKAKLIGLIAAEIASKSES